MKSLITQQELSNRINIVIPAFNRELKLLAENEHWNKYIIRERIIAKECDNYKIRLCLLGWSLQAATTYIDTIRVDKLNKKERASLYDFKMTLPLDITPPPDAIFSEHIIYVGEGIILPDNLNLEIGQYFKNLCIVNNLNDSDVYRLSELIQKYRILSTDDHRFGQIIIRFMKGE